MNRFFNYFCSCYGCSVGILNGFLYYTSDYAFCGDALNGFLYYTSDYAFCGDALNGFTSDCAFCGDGYYLFLSKERDLSIFYGYSITSISFRDCFLLSIKEFCYYYYLSTP